MLSPSGWEDEEPRNVVSGVRREWEVGGPTDRESGRGAARGAQKGRINTCSALSQFHECCPLRNLVFCHFGQN